MSFHILQKIFPICGLILITAKFILAVVVAGNSVNISDFASPEHVKSRGVTAVECREISMKKSCAGNAKREF